MTRDPGMLIPLLLGFAALLWWWHASVRALQQARAAAPTWCERCGWQLLDHTEPLRSLRVTRGERGPVLVRRYRFEVSADRRERLIGGLTTRGGMPTEIWGEGPDGCVFDSLAPAAAVGGSGSDQLVTRSRK